jgi:hypothetical protein
MRKCRFVYSKTGKARYLSHLDTMEVFRRAFSRAGIALKYSEGFNPHPIISIVLPCPLGHASYCELLDVTLADDFGFSGICERLNDALPSGLRVQSANLPIKKPGDLRFIDLKIELFYDRKIPDLELINFAGATWERIDGGFELTLNALAVKLNPTHIAEAFEADFWRVTRLRVLDADGAAYR